MLRSCFDPLPRFMSMRSLAGLVAMVVLGTGLSVYEYLESTRPPQRHPSAGISTSALGDVRAADRASAAAPSDRRMHASGAATWAAPAKTEESGYHGGSSPTCGADSEHRAPPASMWEPAQDSGG